MKPTLLHSGESYHLGPRDTGDFSRIGDDVAHIIGGEIFGQILSQNGYLQLSQEHKNVLHGLLKMHTETKEKLTKIMETQNKLGIKDSLFYILDIVIQSKFLYTINDLHFLTWNTSKLGRSVSLKFFADEKIYEAGWMNFTMSNGDYYKPYFFESLIEVRDTIGVQNFNLTYFFTFYHQFIGPNDHFRFFGRKRLKKMFESIKYLFDVGEKDRVWHTVISMLSIDPKFNFKKHIVTSLNEFENTVIDRFFLKYLGMKTYGFSESLKTTLFQNYTTYDNPRFFASSIEDFLEDGTLSIEDLFLFLETSRYQLTDIHELFFTRSKKIEENIKNTHGTVRDFFSWILSKNISTYKLPMADLRSICYHGAFDDIDKLLLFYHIPRNYYVIKGWRPDFDLSLFGKSVISNPYEILPILTLLYDILLLNREFSFNEIVLDEQNLLQVLALLKKGEVEYNNLSGWGVSEKLNSQVPTNFFWNLDEASIKHIFHKLLALSYSIDEIIQFSIDSGFGLYHIECMIFFPEKNNLKGALGNPDIQPKYFDLRELICHGINSGVTNTDAVGYYLYSGEPLEIIRYLDSNASMHLGKMLYHSDGSIEEYKRLSYYESNSAATIMREILRVHPGFDFRKLLVFFPERVSPQVFSSAFLENILLLLRAYPNIDISKIDKKLILASDRLQNQFDYFRDKYLLPLDEPSQAVIGPILKSDNIHDAQSLNIALLEQLVGEKGMGEFFTQEATFDIARDKIKLMRQKKVTSGDRVFDAREYIRIHTIYQATILTQILKGTQEYLRQSPDTSFLDLVRHVIPKQELLTFGQRYEIILRLKKYFRVYNEVGKYIKKYPNPVDLLYNISPESFNPHLLAGDILVEQEDTNFIFYFSNRADYLEACGSWKNKEGSGGVKFDRSKVPSLSGTISFVDGPKGTVNDFTNKVKIHEGQHIKNGFSFRETLFRDMNFSPINAAKDEVIAYMSDGTLYKDIIDTLTDEKGLYNYYRYLMHADYKAYLKNWRKHIGKLKKFVGIAFMIKSIYPDDYLNLLAVTDVHNWESLLEGTFQDYHVYKKHHISAKDVRELTESLKDDPQLLGIYKALCQLCDTIIDKVPVSRKDLQGRVEYLRMLYQDILDYTAHILRSGGGSRLLGNREKVLMFLVSQLDEYESKKDRWDLVLG